MEMSHLEWILFGGFLFVVLALAVVARELQRCADALHWIYADAIYPNPRKPRG